MHPQRSSMNRELYTTVWASKNFLEKRVTSPELKKKLSERRQVDIYHCLVIFLPFVAKIFEIICPETVIFLLLCPLTPPHKKRQCEEVERAGPEPLYPRTRRAGQQEEQHQEWVTCHVKNKRTNKNRHCSKTCGERKQIFLQILTLQSLSLL